MVFEHQQAINNQSERDTQVIELVSSMKDAYSFLGTLKSMQGITPPLEAYIDATLKQTVECTSFIREYFGIGFMS